MSGRSRGVILGEENGKGSKRMVIVGSVVLLLLIFVWVTRPAASAGHGNAGGSLRYPHQHFYHKYSPLSTSYNIVIVADMDKASKVGDTWQSTLIYGALDRNPDTGLYSITWGREVRLNGPYPYSLSAESYQELPQRGWTRDGTFRLVQLRGAPLLV